MSMSDFVILSKLGEGSYSNVYKIRRIADGNEYALKKSVLEHAFSLKEINGFAHDIARYPEMGNINLVNKRKERIKHAVIFIKKLGYDKETLEKFAGSTYMVIKDEFNK